jgi:hypothetical protein
MGGKMKFILSMPPLRGTLASIAGHIDRVLQENPDKANLTQVVPESVRVRIVDAIKDHPYVHGHHSWRLSADKIAVLGYYSAVLTSNGFDPQTAFDFHTFVAVGLANVPQVVWQQAIYHLVYPKEFNWRFAPYPIDLKRLAKDLNLPWLADENNNPVITWTTAVPLSKTVPVSVL